MRLDPKALRLFLSVCREGTISGAARAMHLSQPSVSAAIARLEDNLSTLLFERHRSGIQLTASGKALYKRAEAMEYLLDAAIRELELLKNEVSGPLTVGGTPGALATLVPPLVTSLSKAHPRFELRIQECTDAELRDKLERLQIEIGIRTTGLEEHPSDLEELSIVSDPFSLIVGKANAHLPDEVSLADLGQARWVLPQAIGGFRRHIDALFINAELPQPANVIRSDSLLTTKAIVRGTDYVTILPDQVAASEIRSGNLRGIAIREATFRRQVGVVWLREQPLSPMAQAFLNHCRLMMTEAS